MARALTSDAFRWIYATPSNLAGWNSGLDDFKRMANRRTVVRAAEAGAKVIQTRMQDLIYQQTGLTQYEAVAERISVWDDQRGVYVGVKPDDQFLPQAEAMERLFPVMETAFALSGDDAKKAFEDDLHSAGVEAF